MIKRKARKPKFPKTANTFSKPSKRFIANVTQQIASASIFKKPKPDPIKALLRKHPGPYKIERGTLFAMKARYVFDTNNRLVAMTKNIVAARAIAALGSKK